MSTFLAHLAQVLAVFWIVFVVFVVFVVVGAWFIHWLTDGFSDMGE